MEAFIGTITLFVGNFVPSGWLACQGQELSINQYPALYSILGSRYGGNGTTTFALPNLTTWKSWSSEGKVYIICYQGIYPMRP